MKALFDTNILVDYLNGVPQAREELDRYDERTISIVVWMEVMVGADGELAEGTRAFLDGFEIVPVDAAVAEKAVELRRRHQIRLPDAIIRAMADVGSMLLVTRNVRDLPADIPGVRHPYRL